MNLLLVEDDEMLGDGIKTVMERRGMSIDWVRDGLSAMKSVKSVHYDVLLLDLNIPWLSGLEVLARLRSEGNQIPVLVLTARSEVVDRVKALDGGADDYVVKPFDIDELCARIRALHRRHSGQEPEMLRHGDLVLDPSAHTVTIQNSAISLSAKEFDILHSLMENMGRVMSRRKLSEKVYCLEDDVESNAIEVHIHHLRKKLGDHPIRTVRGVGYVIEKPGLLAKR
ncbi:MAG: response regulator transcription factor [Candidatus Thiodiazotropha sp. (ex. Lucinisca nassula)]|uniref:DNA-binding response regulator n=3 Tax=Candidatus Thiodiazotropha TaxID=1913444 RepID=A0A1E2UV37_9GAMM|nr:response regulator transcription factor [Candidatus Thiodiazotropha taylori]MBW9259835.1 response regulator transcription factor [Candidatus Thiodiazotropha sp. (ex. Lucinisca nassula)]MCG7897883.1 response regulator transcription factor [Candidatus Thiodiazotropha weberae]MCG7990359.1 response regulator transcription factor [Candidatus Thiodiazotropha lotti]MCG8017028.1 response regulator transcription factor [Candidatus Thiodiazotropha sp. 'RUGA']ODB87253.1 DNA-binding response regulator 